MRRPDVAVKPARSFQADSVAARRLWLARIVQLRMVSYRKHMLVPERGTIGETMERQPRITIAALAGVAAMALACGSSIDAGQPKQGGGGGGTTVTPNLYACGVAHDCLLDAGHLGPISTEGLRCGGKVAASGKKGALKITSQPGPYPTEVENLAVLLGDGTLLHQSRSRCGSDTGCAGQNTTAWKLTALERCKVDVAPAAIAGCSTPNGTCEYGGAAKDCKPVAEGWTCSSLP
jgi:hypothetical protein